MLERFQQLTRRGVRIAENVYVVSSIGGSIAGGGIGGSLGGPIGIIIGIPIGAISAEALEFDRQKKIKRERLEYFKWRLQQK